MLRTIVKNLHFLLFLLVAYCAPTPKAAGQFTEKQFDRMAKRMAKGSVPDISITELQPILDKVILLDTREKEEFEVSHLPNAIWVGYDDFDLERVTGIDKDKKVITYCSVGYRSEKIGEKLQKAGFSNVYNLNGSLFRWVNAGLSIVDSKGEPTQQVHGYNKEWSKWLKRGEIIY